MMFTFFSSIGSDSVLVEASEELLFRSAVRLAARGEFEVSTVQALRVVVKFGLAVSLDFLEPFVGNNGE